MKCWMKAIWNGEDISTHTLPVIYMRDYLSTLDEIFLSIRFTWNQILCVCMCDHRFMKCIHFFLSMWIREVLCLETYQK